ncbi:hypothetical protein GALL_153390 [mine drainage metagenome]|uniref:Uncharacterized protein n=1 Tax=mine drainage metagenome TaxID=410659 RepID=A0A1J5S2J6_9ZZZZ
MIDGTLPGYWDNKVANFTAANGTQAKVLVDVSPAQVAAAIVGEAALPGEASVRQRVMTGGCRVIDGLISSSDSAAKSVAVWQGVQATLYANMGAPTITALNVINRTVGSFVDDGYSVGDSCMLFGATTAANDGVLAQVTAVTALALTFNGTPFTNEASAAGFRIVRVGRAKQIAVPANAGSSDSVSSVSLLLGAQTDSTGIQLGANGMLIAGLVAAASALPAQVSVSANVGLY